MCRLDNHDGYVNSTDFIKLKEYYGEEPPADCNCGDAWPPDVGDKDCGSGPSEKEFQGLIDWLENLWKTDKAFRALFDEEDFLAFLAMLYEELEQY